jgi:hypothetical protein
MKHLYCKKLDENRFDLNYRPLERLKAEYGFTELSDSETIDKLLEMGYFQIEYPDDIDDGYTYRMTLPELVDNVYKVSLFRVNEEETNYRLQNLASTQRYYRQQLLSQSDWTQLADVNLNPEKKAEWNQYRQALRDITSQDKFPFRILWPQAPQ